MFKLQTRIHVDFVCTLLEKNQKFFKIRLSESKLCLFLAAKYHVFCVVSI